MSSTGAVGCAGEQLLRLTEVYRLDEVGIEARATGRLTAEPALGRRGMLLRAFELRGAEGRSAAALKPWRQRTPVRNRRISELWQRDMLTRNMELP